MDITTEKPQSIDREQSRVALMGRTLYCLIAPNSNTEDTNNIVFLCEKAIDNKTVSNILVDISLSDGFSKIARKTWVEFIQNPRITRIAFFGGDIYTDTTVSFIVGAAKTSNCKVFKTKETYNKIQ